MALPIEYKKTATQPAIVPRAFRFTTNIFVLAMLLNQGKEKKLPKTVLHNVSCNGASILSPVALPIGESISLHFYLPESGLPFRAICSIVWSDSKGNCGLRFQKVSEQHCRRLQSWLHEKAVERAALSRALAMPVGGSISESGS